MTVGSQCRASEVLDTGLFVGRMESVDDRSLDIEDCIVDTRTNEE